MRTSTMTRAALMAGVAAVAAQLAVPLPFTPVPFTLQVFAVVLSGLLLGPRADPAVDAGRASRGRSGSASLPAGGRVE